MKPVSALSIVLAAGCAASAFAQVKVAQFTGSSWTESAGYALVGLGDVDGDGLPDFAAGAPWHPNNLTDPGRAYLCKGSNASLIRQLTGNSGGDDFGFALANVGDADGDGVNDVLVGAPDLVSSGGHDSTDASGTTPGFVELFSGATGALLLHVDGDLAGDMFGMSVAGIGDRDGDGVPDFAVGAPGHDGAGTDRGLVRAISGASGATLWTVLGAQNSSSYAARLANVGDLNGDGYDDVLLGATAWNGFAVDSGAAFVLSGADGSTINGWSGLQSNVRFGSSVAGIGDVDGDGVGDVAIGAVEAPWLTSKGTLYVFSPANGTLLYERVGEVNSSYFGFSVAPIGDLDGDGASELAVGAALYETGAAGQYDGAVSILSGASGAEIGRALGAYNEYFGWSVAGLGDANGDGRIELVAGGIDGNFNQRGFARVFTTDTPMPPSKYCVAKVNSQGCKPSISATGSLSASGPDDFTVHASDVINQKFGLFLWGTAPTNGWFQGGTLCVGAPQKRTAAVATGGSTGGADCSGTMAYAFTHAYMQSHGLVPGTVFYVQGWHRDTALAFNKIGLTDGLLAIVAP